MLCIIMFGHHPEQCLVSESSVILDGREHTEYQANQHRKEPGDHRSDDDDNDEHEHELETDDDNWLMECCLYIIL